MPAKINKKNDALQSAFKDFYKSLVDIERKTIEKIIKIIKEEDKNKLEKSLKDIKSLK